MPAVPIKYVVSFTSQDERHPVGNLLSGDGYKKWLCKPGEKNTEIEAVFQLQQPCVITYLDIGSIWCASIEVQVGQSDWPVSRPYETLAHTLSLMTPMDCNMGRNTSKTQMFSSDLFCADIAKKEWDRVRLICRQPYKKLVQYGLSFVRIKTSEAVQSDSTKQENRQMASSVKSIQKHFFGKDKLGPVSTKADLENKLLKIAGTGEAGPDNVQGLSRTAKLVLAAAGPKPKVYSTNSPAPPVEKNGLYSDCLDRKYGPPIEEEIQKFLDGLEISEAELDQITLADVRHRFERKKRRKLTKEEKKVFIHMAKTFISAQFGKKKEQENILPSSSTNISNVKQSALPRIQSGNSRLDSNNRASGIKPETPSAKRKLQTDDDVLKSTPESFREQIKLADKDGTINSSATSVKRPRLDLPQNPGKSDGSVTPTVYKSDGSVTPTVYKGRVTPTVYKSDGSITPTVYKYRGLRHRKDEEEGDSDHILSSCPKTPESGGKQFGDFNIGLPWSPLSSTSDTDCVTSPKVRGRGRGKGRGRGQKGNLINNINKSVPSELGSHVISLDELEDIECGFQATTGRGKGRGRARRGRGARGTKNKSRIDHVFAAEMRPTTFTRCDRCNNYFAAESMAAHQLICHSSKKTNEPSTSSSSTTSDTFTVSSTDWLNCSSPPPLKGYVVSSRNDARSLGQGHSKNVNPIDTQRSPPWLLAAEMRLQHHQKQTVNGNGTMEASRGHSLVDNSQILNTSESMVARRGQSKKSKVSERVVDFLQDSSDGISEDVDSSDTDDRDFIVSDDNVDDDTYEIVSDNIHSGVDSDILVECPLCGCYFPESNVEVHAATCSL